MPNEAKSYDLIIIGGGPAGIAAASEAISLKKTVALVDCHHELGGAGFNSGTVPSKSLREAALAMSGLKNRNLAGVELSLRKDSAISDFLGRNQNVRALFNHGLKTAIESRLNKVLFGQATFVDAHTVSVAAPPGQGADAKPFVLRAEHILIATGSSPVLPEVFTYGNGRIYDSATIPQLDRVPKTLAIIGAGVIGSEYGCTFTELGSTVHIIDERDALLPFLDAEISAALKIAMARAGVNFHWKETVQKCELLPSGETRLTLTSGLLLNVGAVLVAVGRKSNTEGLGLAVVGVKTGELGIIPVDSHYRSNVSHILAAGDVIGFPALASTSMEQARRAVASAFGQAVSATSPLLPNGIYTIPEVSMVGETEESLIKEGVDYVVGRARYMDNARGQSIGDKAGFLKLLVRRDTMQLLGVHVIGEQATELIHIGLMAMQDNSPVNRFVDTCFNIPTLGALYKAAAQDAVQQIGESELGLPSFY